MIDADAFQTLTIETNSTWSSRESSVAIAMKKWEVNFKKNDFPLDKFKLCAILSHIQQQHFLRFSKCKNSKSKSWMSSHFPMAHITNHASSRLGNLPRRLGSGPAPIASANLKMVTQRATAARPCSNAAKCGGVPNSLCVCGINAPQST